tara:strand:+ start:249 stop:776 length:528 start_codon:yes stop_codon:yes gene_type:complete
LIIKKNDISSIFPIIINIIKLSLEVVSKLAKLIPPTPYISALVVFVIASIESLKDFSKSILSIIKILDSIKRLIKKDIKIKNDILTLSSLIFFSELNKFLLIILLGLINFKISIEAILSKIYNLANLIPEVFETNEPPTIVINIKYKLKLLSEFIKDKPELFILLNTPMIISKPP